ncbi:VanZ family protein [Tichowtungia aerotolerans]|uniref:VanZ-like domain-containing protein n=1 Tax=Tichowtungia aerotolerans TaxID=2697043 RepID=A0A6P1M9F4_9BACT|nr:VanZ family protein [Tichowtungia aerotolerans]QHI69693.1 hypothetical protein GT409_09585 [Tichowtungia aerotolerans]
MFGKKPPQIRHVGLFAALTVAAMALFFNLYEPWQAIGPERIVDGSFESPDCAAEWTGWDERLARLAHGDGYRNSTGVILEATPRHHSTLRKTIPDIKNIPAFKVSVRAKAEKVHPGTEGYHLPRTIFFYRNSKGKGMYNHSHTVFGLKKDTRWKRYSSIFPVPENSMDGRLQLQNLGSSGTLYVDDVSVIPVSPRPTAPFFQVLFILLWIGAFSACLLALSPWTSRTGTATLLCATGIIAGVLLPGEFLNRSILRTADMFQKTVQRITPPKPETPSPAQTDKIPAAESEPRPEEKPAPHQPKPPAETPADTFVRHTYITGHFSLFLILAALSMLTWAPAHKPNRIIFAVLAGLTLFAASTEVLQFLTPDRKAGLDDLAVDFSGILIAVALTTLLTIPRRIRRTAKSAGHPKNT